MDSDVDKTPKPGDKDWKKKPESAQESVGGHNDDVESSIEIIDPEKEAAEKYGESDEAGLPDHLEFKEPKATVVEAETSEAEPEDEASELDQELERVEGIGSHKDEASEPEDGGHDSPDTVAVVEASSSESGKTAQDMEKLPVATSSSLSADVNPVILAARTKQQGGEKRSSLHLIVILLSVLLAVLVAAGIYFYMQQASASEKANSPQSQLDSSLTSNSALKKQLNAVQQTPVAQPSTSTRTIPEWGIKYPVTTANKGLTYTYSVVTEGTQQGITRLSFSTQEISAIKSQDGDKSQSTLDNSYPCDSSSGVSGTITRYTKAQLDGVKKDSIAAGLGTTSATPYDAIKQQIGDYYYSFTSPQQNGCVGLDDTKAATAVEAVKALVSSFTQS